MNDNPREKAWEYQYYTQPHLWRDQTRDLPKDVFTGKIVLELGCGNGKTAAGILAQSPAQLVGIDFAKSAVRACQKRFANEKKAVFDLQNMTKLNLSTTSVDIVVAYHALGHLLVSERKKAVKEIQRVLKKGGRVYVEDFARGDLRSEKGIRVEKNTVQRGNGITYHYFTRNELETLFSAMKRVSLEKKEQTLRLGKESVVRKEWQGIWEKKGK